MAPSIFAQWFAFFALGIHIGEYVMVGNQITMKLETSLQEFITTEVCHLDCE
jgi:hypothetical protein